MQEIIVNSIWKEKLKHDFFDNESTRLVVVLPGQGYQSTYPLLYYITNLSCEMGYDVLSINYGFHMKQVPFILKEDNEALEKEIVDAINCIDLGKYDSVVLVGKSLGTTFMKKAAELFEGKDLKFVYLTPPDRSISDVIGSNSYFIYGTNDKLISDESKAKIKSSPSIYFEIKNGDHVLETGKTSDDLIILGEVVSKVGQFIKSEVKTQ